MESKNKGGGQKPPLLPICLPTYQRSKEPVHNLHTLWPYYNQIPCRHGLVYICTHCKYTNGSVDACQVICSLHWVCLLLTMLRPKKWGSLIFTKSQTCWKSSCPVALTWKKQPIQHYRWLTPGWRNSSLLANIFLGTIPKKKATNKTTPQNKHIFSYYYRCYQKIIVDVILPPL